MIPMNRDRHLRLSQVPPHWRRVLSHLRTASIGPAILWWRTGGYAAIRQPATVRKALWKASKTPATRFLSMWDFGSEQTGFMITLNNSDCLTRHILICRVRLQRLCTNVKISDWWSLQPSPSDSPFRLHRFS